MEYLKGKKLMVACGVGRDSTALLVGLHHRGIRPDAILFADVGSEKQQTYDYIPVLNGWLERVGFPTLTIVRYTPKSAPYKTLEGNLTMNATLPGATFNMASCTLKFKVEPQNRWTRNWPVAQAAWARGEAVVKMIGFECDEEHRLKRAADKAHAGKGTKDATRYEYHYPLMEWGWSLKRCQEEIANAGLPVPTKSACFFCPNQKPWEVTDLLSPMDRARIIRMELRAEPYNRKVFGLWRKERKRDGRPGSITEYILQKGLPFMPLAELERLDPMPLNPAAKKFKAGYTFNPPHNTRTLRMILREAGHDVPASIACEQVDDIAVMQGTAKLVGGGCGGCSAAEDAVHGEIIESL
jgi:hypothetical protein